MGKELVLLNFYLNDRLSFFECGYNEIMAENERQIVYCVEKYLDKERYVLTECSIDRETGIENWFKKGEYNDIREVIGYIENNY